MILVKFYENDFMFIAFITTMVASPIDVMKTRFMNSLPGQYSGLGHCAGNMWKEKGLAAFYKG